MPLCKKLNHHIVSAGNGEPGTTFVVKVFDQLYLHKVIGFGIELLVAIY